MLLGRFLLPEHRKEPLRSCSPHAEALGRNVIVDRSSRHTLFNVLPWVLSRKFKQEPHFHTTRGFETEKPYTWATFGFYGYSWYGKTLECTIIIVPYHTMHPSEQKCVCSEWCIVGYETGGFPGCIAGFVNLVYSRPVPSVVNRT